MKQKTSVQRVAMIISSKGWGGREMAPLMFMREMNRRGVATAILTDPDSPTGKRAMEWGLQVEPLRFRGYLNPATWGEFSRALASFRPQVIHVHLTKDLWTVVPGIKWAHWPGPLVLTKHVGSAVVKKDIFHRWLYNRVDLALGCSEVIRKNVVETCPIPSEKTGVVFEPVDMERFQFNAQARRRFRKQWNVRNGKVVGMVARLTPGKGHELLLRTAAGLKKDFPNLSFRIAGHYSVDEEGFYKGLLKLREELGLSDIFHYEGFVSDVPGFLSALDLAVHAADAEAFGMAVAEAMACGKPVAVRRGGGVAEILETPKGVKGGVILEGNDPDTWIKALAGLLRSPATLKKMSSQARPTAERFGLKVLTDRHLGWYGQLLGRKTMAS